MYDPRTSPNDPIFFPHHFNIDRLWYVWQMENPSVRTYEYGGNKKTGSKVMDAKLTDVLHMFGLAADLLVNQTMNTTSGGIFCYVYSNSVVPLSFKLPTRPGSPTTTNAVTSTTMTSSSIAMNGNPSASPLLGLNLNQDGFNQNPQPTGMPVPPTENPPNMPTSPPLFVPPNQRPLVPQNILSQGVLPLDQPQAPMTPPNTIGQPPTAANNIAPLPPPPQNPTFLSFNPIPPNNAPILSTNQPAAMPAVMPIPPGSITDPNQLSLQPNTTIISRLQKRHDHGKLMQALYQRVPAKEATPPSWSSSITPGPYDRTDMHKVRHVPAFSDEFLAGMCMTSDEIREHRIQEAKLRAFRDSLNAMGYVSPSALMHTQSTSGWVPVNQDALSTIQNAAKAASQRVGPFPSKS